MVDGPNTYGFCGGDPVNRVDPMGTTIEIKGKLYQKDELKFQNKREQFLYNLMAESDHDFYFHSEDQLRELLSLPHQQDIFIESMEIGKKEYEGDLNALDFAVGVTRVPAEPALFVYTGGRAVCGLERVSSDDLGECDSAIFKYYCNSLDEGTPAYLAAPKTSAMIFIRGNPFTGIPLAANDVYQGFATGDYERAGGGTAGIGLQFFAVRGSLRAYGTNQFSLPTFRGYGMTINHLGWSGFAQQQFGTFPTFKSTWIYYSSRYSGQSPLQSAFAANRYIGNLHEEVMGSALQRLYPIVQEQVSIRPNSSSGSPVGYNFKPDFLVQSQNGAALFYEGKGSLTAPLTPRQTTGIPLFEQNGGTVRGANGGTAFPAGTSLQPQQVIILRWVNGGWVPCVVEQREEGR